MPSHKGSSFETRYDRHGVLGEAEADVYPIAEALKTPAALFRRRDFAEARLARSTLTPLPSGTARGVPRVLESMSTSMPLEAFEPSPASGILASVHNYKSEGKLGFNALPTQVDAKPKLMRV